MREPVPETIAPTPSRWEEEELYFGGSSRREDPEPRRERDWSEDDIVPREQIPDHWNPSLWAGPLQGVRLVFLAGILALIACILEIGLGVEALDAKPINWLCRLGEVVSGALGLAGLFFLRTVPVKTRATGWFTGALIFGFLGWTCFVIGSVLAAEMGVNDPTLMKSIETLSDAFDGFAFLVLLWCVSALTFLVTILVGFRRMTKSLRQDKLSNQFLVVLILFIAGPFQPLGWAEVLDPEVIVGLIVLLFVGTLGWSVCLLNWTLNAIHDANADFVQANAY